METFIPKDKDDIVVRMNEQQLRDALQALEESGADEIGIPLRRG